MTIIDHLNWRYATKKFDDNFRLDEDKLEILKEAFNLTALSYGLQTLKLVVISDKAKRKALVEYAYGQKQVSEASHLLVLCIQNNIDDSDVDSHFNNVESIRNTPKSILEPFKAQLNDTIAKMPDTKKLEWATRQAYIALGNLMTVCAIEKIDSCPMEGFIPEAFDQALGLDDLGLKSVLLLPVGKRSEDDNFATFKKVRMPIQQTVLEM